MKRTGTVKTGINLKCIGILLYCIVATGIFSTAEADEPVSHDKGSGHDLIYQPAYRLAGMIRAGEL